MTNNAELDKIRVRALPRGIGTLHPVFTERAENAEIWDIEGRRFIDLAAGIAVVNTGHNHPKVKAAVARQLEAFTHTCFMVTPYEAFVRLADRLNRLAPGPTPKKSFFVTTGAEAVENAIKVARAYTKRTSVISFSGGFHGRTFMAMALTGKVVPYKAGFGPFPAEIYHAPFPNTYHGVSVEDSLGALDRLFKTDVEPSRVAAIIVEPVQGEGGFYIAPPEFLRALRSICDEHGILLIADEIQTGFGRTGKTFAMEHADVEPDLITVAKALGGGLPLAGLIGKAKIMDAPEPGGLGGTYAGPPLACAAALAVLDVMDEEDLNGRSVAIGARMTERLKKIQARSNGSPIGDIRNLGAMIAIELVEDGDADRPDPALTKEVLARARDKGLLLLSCGVRGNVIRFLPPLTIQDDLIDEAMDILEDVFDECGH